MARRGAARNDGQARLRQDVNVSRTAEEMDVEGTGRGEVSERAVWEALRQTLLVPRRPRTGVSDPDGGAGAGGAIRQKKRC